LANDDSDAIGLGCLLGCLVFVIVMAIMLVTTGLALGWSTLSW
jgi:hypothetical protein